MITQSFSSTFVVVIPISANVCGPLRGGSEAGLPSGMGAGDCAWPGRSRRGGPKEDCAVGGRGVFAELPPGSESAYRGAFAKGLGDSVPGGAWAGMEATDEGSTGLIRGLVDCGGGLGLGPAGAVDAT